MNLFVAIGRPCKVADAELPPQALKTGAAPFLRHLIGAVPDKIHTVLTDHGIQCTNRQRDPYAFQPIFARVCQEHAIEHRLTKTNHPWTNGRVERMNRTLKAATVKKYHDQTHQHLKEHLYAFRMAHLLAKRLKTLRGLTPYEYICQCWQKEPERFSVNPCHHTLGLNITDQLKSCGAALRGVLPSVDHRQHRYLYNRAEISHHPTRQRERRMQRFKSPRHAQRFLSAYGPIVSHFRPRHHRLSAPMYRQEMRQHFQTWQEITGAARTA
jgi:hypothetical protein